ncbi:MAG TPA: hypothetical protein VEL05_12385, partial [Candidatus Acidoferrum sp.]|nr:hypothetical protein [Candidatus Acidoferrum sp.]
MELAGGASGYRIDVVLQLDQDGLIRPECPYASWLALAGEDAVVPGGVLAVVRSAGPIWRAAIGLLNSLEILGPSRVSSRPSGSSARTSLLDLPLVRRR